MKTGLARIFLLLVMVDTPMAHAQLADAGRGRALYENHCQVCHTSKIHVRPNRIAVARSEVRAIVANWQRQEKLNWNDQDIDDVVEFLDRTKYFFK